MKFLSDILAKAGLTVDGVVTLNNTATGQTPASNDNSTKLATTAWVRTFVQPYSLPIASTSILGGIKVGSGLSIDAGTGVLSAVAGGSASIKSTQTFTATAGQTVFTISGGYTVGLVDVFLNGVYLSPNQTTATNGTTVTLGDAALVGDIIDVIIASPVYQGATTTTDQLSEGTTNLYFTNARARAAISETVTGLDYNSSTGVLSITTGYGIPTTASQTNWNAAYNDKINSAAVTGSTTKTLTLTQQDGGTVTATWTDDNTDAVTSVFGRTGVVVAVSGDYTTTLVTEGTNLYYTDARARAAISVTGSGSYNSATGVITVTGGVTSVNTLTGAVVLTTTNIAEGTNLYYTQARFDTAFTAKSTTNLTEGTNLYYTSARANADFDTRLATKSTSNLSEGTNLYYTDARVGTYLTANSYATQTYVGTQIANLVAAAPATLDTLNELAAALGNDPSFATTVSTSIGTKVPQTRTITINGTTFDLSANRTYTINSMVYPGAGIALSTGSAWGTSITDNSANWNTAFGWGNHASGGYLTTALAATTYASLTGAYANPAFVASLAYSKITGVPAFITSYTEVDTLATVTGRGASTSTAILINNSLSVNGGTVNLATYTSSEARLADGSIHLMKTSAAGIFEAVRAINSDTTIGTTVRLVAAATSDPFNNTNGGKVFIDAVRTATNMDLVFSLNDVGGAAPVERVRFTGGGNLIATGTIAASNYSGTHSGSSSGTNTGDQINISGTAAGETLATVTGRGSTTTASISAANFQNGYQVLSLDNIKVPGLYNYDGGISGTQPAGTNWYNVRTIEIGADSRYSQFVMPYNVDRIFYRRKADAGFGAYVELYHTGNLPTIPTNNNQLTNGAGYITGISSGNVTTALGYTPWNYGAVDAGRNIGASTNLDTDLESGGVYGSYGAGGTSWNAPFSYGAVLAFAFTSGIKAQFGFDIRHNQSDYGDLRYRTKNNLGYSTWRTMWHSGNLTNNNQLTNGAGYITSSSLTAYLPLAGGTMSGTIGFTNVVGNKIDFYYSGDDRYGIQVQSSELRIHSGAQGASSGGITLGKSTGSTFTEHLRIRNDGIIQAASYLRTAGVTSNAVLFSAGASTVDFGNALGQGTSSRSTFFRGNTNNVSVWWGGIDGNGANIPYGAIDAVAGEFSFWRNSGGTGGGDWTRIMTMNASGLTMNSGNFIGTLTGNAATVSDGVYLSSTQSITGTKYFVSNRNTSSDSPPLQAYSSNGSGAIMSFHRGGYYAVNMGLDSDNVFRIGGWSAAANRLQLDMSGNLTVAGAIAGSNLSGTNTGDQTNISGYATYLPTAYVGGQQTNPQVYFNNGIGLKAAMTGAWSVWSDTLWINGYSGGDVKQMCALHTLRNGTPRMAISVQAHDATAYGTFYEVITAYNIASQTVALAGNITAYTINQSVGTGNSPSFAGLTINTGGTGTWGPFVVTSTSQWGDGGTQYVTIGAGGAAGIMINNPHIVWNAGESAAAAKYGRSGGISSGAYYVAGTGASDNFFITKNGAIGSPQLNINSSGNATFSGTVTASNLSGTNTGDQTNISGNAATASSVAWSNVASKPAGWLNTTNLIDDNAPVTAVPSGFYQNYNGSGNPTGTWFNYINVRHSNPANGHGFQIGMSYYDTNLWFRSYQGGTSPTYSAWGYAISSLNIASQSVSYASTAGTATDSTKLALTGGNLSGHLTFSQPVGLGFANGQYVRDNGNGGFIIYGAALIQLNSNTQTSGPVVIGGNFSNNAYNSVGSTRLMFGGGNSDADENYYIGTNFNNYGGNYTKLELRWHTGIRMGAQPGYGGIRMYNTEDLNTVIFSVGETDNHVRGYYDIIAYASDKRLKHNIQPIENALSKVKSLTGMTYQWNEVGKQYGWEPDTEIREVGVFAQDVQAVLPEAVRPAPFDHELGKSKSGENFLTVKYEKMVPLLIEAIKEQQTQIESQKSEIDVLKDLVQQLINR